MIKIEAFKKCVVCILIPAFVFSTIPGLLTAREARAELPCWNDGRNAGTEGGNKDNTDDKGDFNQDGQAKGADDVNFHNGNFNISQQDFFIPTRGVPLEIVRTYNSQDPIEGPFGFGWNHNFAPFYVWHNDLIYTKLLTMHLPYPALTRRNPDGSKDRFHTSDGVTYTASRGCYDRLTREDNTFILTEKHGSVWEIDATSGHVISVEDRNGNALDFAYDGNGRLKSMSDDGRSLTLSYGENGKVSDITDHADRTYQYGYDESNNLISVINPEGYTITYSYDTDHRLTSITDARGTTWLTNTYDIYGRVVTQVADGGTYRVSYDGAPTSQETTVTQPNDSQTLYEMDEYGQATRITRDLGKLDLVTTNTYDENGNLTSLTNPRGYMTRYEYDQMGNLLKIRRKASTGFDNDETDIITTFTYQPDFNLVKTITDPRGNVTTFSYDENGNLSGIAYPQVEGITPAATFTYNDHGQVLTATDPNGVVTKYEYHPSTGYLSKIVKDYGEGRLNYTHEMTFDPVGNITSVTDARGNTTSFTYDSINQLTKTVPPSPFQYETRYTYDKSGNLQKVYRQKIEHPTDFDDDSTWQITSYTYTAFDKLETITDDMGHVTTFGYDTSGNRTSVKDANGNETTYVYSERNLLWKVVDAENHMTEYIYDANGNLYEIKDARDNATRYLYDAFDRLQTTTYQDNKTETYEYGKANNVIKKTDRENQTIKYSYDALNRLLLKTYPDAGIVTYAYDLGSILTEVTDATGTMSYTYDRANRITGVSYPSGKSVGYEYDANGNRTKLAYPDTTWIAYLYDELNRLTDINDSENNNIAHYSYDALSRRTQLDLVNNTQTLYQYDDANRPLNLVNKVNGGANISTFNYGYDAVGNRHIMTTAAGTHRYSYDKIYQMTAVDYPDGFPFPDTDYNYDAVGNRTSTDNGGTIDYTTNSINQYTDVGGTAVTYDDNGNLTSDGTNSYTYDYENRLISATTPDHPNITYKYDPFGRRIEKNVDGVVTKFVYDGDQVIGEYDGSDSLQAKYVYGVGIDEVLRMKRSGSDYYYHFDGLGSVNNITDFSASTLETYKYDVYGKANITSSLDNPYMFTGRRYDPETGLYYYRARYYDAKIGRFLQKDPITWGPDDPRILNLSSFDEQVFKIYLISFGLSEAMIALLSPQNYLQLISAIGLKNPQYLHSYSYCFSNPVNFIDPWGLSKKEPWWEKIPWWFIGEHGGQAVATAGAVQGAAGIALGGAGIAGASVIGGAVESARKLEPLFTRYYKGTLGGTEFEDMLSYTPEQERLRKQLRKGIFYFLFDIGPERK